MVSKSNERPPLFDRIDEYVVYHALRTPGNEAMVLGNHRICYAEMQVLVDRIASGLLAAGVKKGDRIATLSTPTPDFFLIFLATASIGAIWTGLNPRYCLNEYQYIIADSQPVLLFARVQTESRDFTADLLALKAENSCIEGLIAIGTERTSADMISMDEFLFVGDKFEAGELADARACVDTMDPVTIIYTSGTTGKPKGAMLSHHGLCRVFRNQLPYWYAKPLSMLNYLPINHIGCLGDISCFMLIGGGKIVFMEKFEPAESMQLVQDENITVWGGVPTSVQMCLSLENFDQYDLSSVQIIVFGGASPPEELVSTLAQLDMPFSNTYGLTETTSSVTYVGPGKDVDLIANTIGKPLPDYEVRVVKANGDIARTQETGEIQVRGSFIMLGYWNLPEATDEAIDADGWLHTGDLVKVREDGNLVFVGRSKEMFKSGGYNVYPLEVEAAIERCPLVNAAVVVSAPDDLYAEVGYAFVLPEPGLHPTTAELKLHCGEVLANYKVPKKFFIRNELPTLPIGKVDRSALKAEALTLAS